MRDRLKALLHRRHIRGTERPVEPLLTAPDVRRVEVRAAPVPGLARIGGHPATRLLLAGVLIGGIAGVAAGALDRAIVLLSSLILGAAEPSVASPETWRRIIGPTLGGLVATTAVCAAAGRRRPQGVHDVLARVQTHEHVLSLRDSVVSAAGAVLAIGGGQSGGREGPIVQLASTLAARVVGILGIAPRYARTLVAAGGAAGIAASFNTPIAGAFFALEILIGNFAIETFGSVIAATVTGTVVGQLLLGDRVALHLPAFRLHDPRELLLYSLLGAVCGAVGTAFKRSLAVAGAGIDRLGLPPALRGGVAGLVVGGVAALGMPEVMGNGYAFMEALSNHPQVHGAAFLAVLLVAKIVASSATVAGRSGAGVFAPSLFMGVVTGTLCGELFAQVFPRMGIAPGAYGMVGMAALVGATLHAPLTMSLMLFEMTRDYAVILPLLAAVATSTIVSRALTPESIYEAELRHQGLALARGREELVMHDLSVGDVMRTENLETLPLGAPLGDIVARFLSRRTDMIFLLDDAGRVAGVLDIQDAKHFFADPGETGATLLPRPVPTLRAEQRLPEAIRAFFDADAEELPVVGTDGRLVGLVDERDVVAAYDREILRQAVPLTRVVHDARGRRDELELAVGEVLRIVPVRPWMVGKRLEEVEPGRCQCAVIAIRTPGQPPVRRAARPRSVLRAGDELVVIGPVAGVNALAESKGVLSVLGEPELT